MTTHGEGAADRYAARVDSVLAQRTRLRGPQPPGDKRAGCPADHPLVKADPLRPLDPNLAVIASYIEAEDVIIDVGGGAGRMSLPLALRCRQVINVEPSPTMAIGFRANAAAAGISNTRIIEGEWPDADAPAGSVALVNHVTYMTREIAPFIKKLEQAGRRRVLITVNSVPGPSLQRVLFQLVHGEEEVVVPGHVELINVIWELGILPDIRVLPQPTMPFPPVPSREAAIAGAGARFPGEQWGWWDLGFDLKSRLRSILETRFDELFTGGPESFIPRYIPPGREILITWEPAAEHQAR
jgi:Methyltransferase domain